MRVKQAEAHIKKILEFNHLPSIEAGWILQDVLGVSVADYALMGREEISEEHRVAVHTLVERRIAGEPLQYVLGNTEFYGRRFHVAPGVLIPRPETETLVELALSLPRPSDDVCDLCSGSGVIALTVACELGEKSHVVAADISVRAIKLGEKNKRALGCSNVSFFQSDLFDAVPSTMRFGLIISNPPYVSAAEFADLPREVRDYEPGLALVADNDGMALLDRLTDEGRKWLRPGGWLICEMGETHGDRMRALLSGRGYDHVEIKRDLTGRERFAMGRLSRR